MSIKLDLSKAYDQNQVEWNFIKWTLIQHDFHSWWTDLSMPLFDSLADDFPLFGVTKF